MLASAGEAGYRCRGTLVASTERTDDLRILAAVTAAYTIGVLAGNLQPLVIGALIDSLGLDAADAGFLGSIELATIAAASFVLAPRMAAIPRRTLIVAGGALAAAGYICSAVARSFIALAVCRVIAGTGGGMVLAIGNAAVSGCQRPDRMFAQMIVAGTLLITGILAALPAAVAAWGYQGTYGGMAVVVGVLLPLLLWIPDRAMVEQAHGGTHAAHAALGMATAAAAVLLFFGQSAMWAFSERIAIAAELNRAQISVALSGSTLAGLCGAVGANWIGLRYRRTSPLLTGILATGGTILALVYTRGPVAYTTILVANGIAYLFMVPYVMGTAAALDPHGRWAAATVGAANVGAAFGPGIAGKVIAFAGYVPMGWLIFAGAILSAAAVAPVSRRLDRAEDRQQGTENRGQTA